MTVASDRSQTLPKLAHFNRLLDENGLLQHSNLSEPDPSLGYSIDDNARGLVALSLLEKISPSKENRKKIQILVEFINQQRAGGGGFRNYLYVTESGDFLSREEAGDGLGQVIWACGYHNHLFPKAKLTPLCTNLLEYGLLKIQEQESLRATSYALAGLAYQHLFQPKSKYRQQAAILAKKLMDKFKESKKEGWDWFEDWLVYGNAILPWSLLVYGRGLAKPRATKIGLASLDFLNQQTMLGHLALPVGQGRWYEREKVRSVFDQQPIEAAYNVMANLEGWRATKEREYLTKAQDWLDWFWGNNIENLNLIDEADGGCYDGLKPWQVNQNKGAESTVCYLIAHLMKLAHDKKIRTW